MTDLEILEALEELDNRGIVDFTDWEVEFMESMMTKLKVEAPLMPASLTERQREAAQRLLENY